MITKTVVLLVAISMFAHHAMDFSQSVGTYKTTRQLLFGLNGVRGREEELVRLFRQGDDRIADLIRALDDSDRVVSRNAQVIIRYLGNEMGMRAVIQGYGKGETYVIAGPVPLPLREWDYKYINDYYSGQPKNWDNRLASYVYALGFDASPEAKAALDRLVKSVDRIDESTAAGRAFVHVTRGQRNKLLSGQRELGKLVLDNAFFIAAGDRSNTSARLLGFDGAQDKALVEVHIDGGPLAEEWYHVVIIKCDQGWKFYSITQVAVS
ncbi:MAG TPA: hypothetical protein VJ023_18845 [Pyrinomonadaceae bacterium]|nr:hypothetical protein [Pyrinomonadaceae bacterium]